MWNCFSLVDQALDDPILGIDALFQADKRKEKVNLGIGVYQTECLRTPVLSCVKKAEKVIFEVEDTKSYQPIEGREEYAQVISSLLFGKERDPSYFTVIQTLGGAGALRLGGEFLHEHLKASVVIPSPSWPNHRGIFSQCGLPIGEYPYYDFSQKRLAFTQMKAFLSGLASGSVVLLHANCHNPSGSDLSSDEWVELATLCKERKLLPFFDAAYLGFDGTFEEDAYALRLFVREGIPFLLALSFSKNFSLYGERVGALIVFAPPSCAKPVLSQLRVLVRRNYSNPPLHGAKIVTKVLQEPSLRQEWEEELAVMRERISRMRKGFVLELATRSPHKDYDRLLSKKGLFSYCALQPKQVERLRKERAVYLSPDGRVNVTGLLEDRIPYVVESIISVGG